MAGSPPALPGRNGVPLALPLTFFSYLALCLGLAINNGEYHSAAVAATAFPPVGLTLALFLSARSVSPPAAVALRPALLYGIFISFLFFLIAPQVNDPGPIEFHHRFLLFIGALFLLCVCYALIKSDLGKKILFFLLISVWLLASLWLLKNLPEPQMDVWTIQQNAAQSLLHGENPYGKIFYVPLDVDWFQVTDRYVYPPASLLFTLPFYALFGDVRYAFLTCHLASCLLLLGICRNLGKSSEESRLFALLFLLNPIWYFILQKSWTEPLCILLLFASIYFTQKKLWKTSAVFQGVFLGAKQYLPPSFFLLEKVDRKKAGRNLILFLAFLILPLIFWVASPHDFYRSVVEYHLNSPFRKDALTLTAFLDRTFGATLPGWLPFVCLAGLSVAAYRASQISRSFLYTALAYYLFFWLNKQAFGNYYFFVESLLILTLAFIPHPAGDSG